MDLSVPVIMAVVGVGFVAGFINMFAGSGSLLTLPMLMFLGLPANVANGTNRIAIFLQNVVAVGSYKKQKVLYPKLDYKLALPAVAGSLIGASLAVNINEQMMEYTIAGLLIVMFFFILLKPDRWVKSRAGAAEAKPRVWQYVVFFFIGIYGGFIQAGVGFFLLAGLVLAAGYDLVKANAVKVFIVLIYTAFAIGVFFWNEQINLQAGLILAVGNMLGALVGARFAVKWGARFVRYILLAALLGSALHLLGLFNG